MITAYEQYDVVVIVASMGGIAAIGAILAQLPADFPVPILVVQHRGSGQRSHLAAILGRCTDLRVEEAAEGHVLVPGVVYVAPSTHHLVITEQRTLGFMDGTRIKYLLSAGDPLFTSAADAFHGGVIAVVLTGTGANGSRGVVAVKRAGGVVLAQDKATSEWFEMPQAAIATGSVDKVLPLREIAPELVRLARAGHVKQAL